ncbi:hypothetical protein COT94_03770 [Candidatus Falkowbacteria bacterium CG10_big_fil_rev_8_21_14_0_10_37_14]|uniref:DUF5673 domain-containing protein n=1 Tax=Candidatus Falkowbacteria bacterium CG10_big_fil_rev_8_21_14_0_10_37_14 TaxID=1974561 RepID=A0A2M6WSE7_9BACT|nr:hypothetical protein [Candidatus Falkowbacteria bacterium]PIT95682.1 MAG: hypothetical protein COT94_03770 [Candidatus Falkowbacteria bacterium CG10_big_fil_rev_8_21_14_0_10_37_14]
MVNDNKIELPRWGRELMTWEIPSYDQHERGLRWYIIFGVITGGLLLLSLATPNLVFNEPNYLFAVMIVLVIFIFITNVFREPEMLEFTIASEGVIIGDRLYDYDELKHFCILHKPHEKLSALYFEFKNGLRPRLTVPMLGANPIQAREFLARYMTEDLERTDEPNTDFIARIFKI